MSRSLLFVYGTLMRGEPNAAQLGAARFVTEAVTRPFYTLVDLGAYPALLEGGATAVAGELYEVDLALLRNLDVFEDVPTLYARREVALADAAGRAEAYVLAAPAQGARVISSGAWRSRLNP